MRFEINADAENKLQGRTVEVGAAHDEGDVEILPFEIAGGVVARLGFHPDEKRIGKFRVQPDDQRGRLQPVRHLGARGNVEIIDFVLRAEAKDADLCPRQDEDSPEKILFVEIVDLAAMPRSTSAPPTKESGNRIRRQADRWGRRRPAPPASRRKRGRGDKEREARPSRRKRFVHRGDESDGTAPSERCRCHAERADTTREMSLIMVDSAAIRSIPRSDPTEAEEIMSPRQTSVEARPSTWTGQS